MQEDEDFGEIKGTLAGIRERLGSLWWLLFGILAALIVIAIALIKLAG